MKIQKASPGLDQRNRLGALLGPGFEVEDFDPALPLEQQVADADVLLVRDVPITRAVMEAAPHLRLVQRPGDHLPHIDLDHAAQRGILISRFPSRIQAAPARDVAEHAFYLLLALAKRDWLSRDNVRARKVGLPKTTRVHGKTLGLVGLGNTGTELARLAVGFGMRVICVKRTPDPAAASALGLNWLGTMDRLPELLAQSDFVSLHLPQNATTVDAIGASELVHMKPGACLINIARAPMLNKAALFEALRSGRLAGAGLDVWWGEPADPADPLLALPQVMLTPHIAGDTAEVEQNLAELAAENIRRLARGEHPLYVVGVDVEPG